MGIAMIRRGWTIRHAIEADAEVLAEINAAAWRHTYRGIVPDGLLAGLTAVEHVPGWLSYLRRPDPTAMFVAVRGGTEIGAYCGVGPVRRDADRHPDLRTGELHAIYANPPVRGTGAGHAVHEAALAHLTDRGFQHVVLWVMRENVESRDFYRAHGWHDDGVADELMLGGRPIPEVRYSRPLPAVVLPPFTGARRD